MATPYVTVDLDRLEANTRAVVTLCADRGILVTGVTKVVCGDPEVARAMRRGGVAGLGDSRLENLARLRAAGIDAPLLLLRVPPLSRADEVVAVAGASLDSEAAVLAALSRVAASQDRRHPVIVMVDLGDLREGIWPDELPGLLDAVTDLPGIELVGLGSNLTCFGGVVPTVEAMTRLVELTELAEERRGAALTWISGGNSSALPLIASGQMPARINHVRVGEAILLGRETVRRSPWPGTVQDAFRLHAEIVELKRKPSVPMGPIGEDAFGGHPTFEDRGPMVRALVNVGRQDVAVEGLTPADHRLQVVGASSDYLIVDVTAAAGTLRVGDEIEFDLGYSALLAAMDSAYVATVYR